MLTTALIYNKNSSLLQQHVTLAHINALFLFQQQEEDYDNEITPPEKLTSVKYILTTIEDINNYLMWE